VLASTSSGDSLANLNTAVLPNGAMVSVTQDQSLWMLDKTSTATTIPDEIIAPGSGPGRWFRFATNAARSRGLMVVGQAFNAFAVDTNWGQSTGNTFIVDGTTPEDWVLTASGCILTYTGPSRRFLVNLSASVRVTNVGAPRDVFLGISLQNDLTGAPSAGTSGEVDAVLAVADTSVCMSTVRLVTLATGQTLRPKMAGPAAALGLSAMIRMSITPSD
jgi:hypothetical protein